MRFWQQACSQSRRANRVRFIENRFAPRFETRERHQKSEPNNQSEQSEKRLLQCGNVAARSVTTGVPRPHLCCQQVCLSHRAITMSVSGTFETCQTSQ